MKIVATTGSYLVYLIISYLFALVLMAVIVWQVWGDQLLIFRNLQISTMYTMALFDMKSMYIGQEFMGANQFGTDSMWLFFLIIIFSSVLHYSVTLQYSAYFHIYFKISKKYEEMLHTSHK